LFIEYGTESKRTTLFYGHLLKKKMPNWVFNYQYGIFGRVIRVIALFLATSLWQTGNYLDFISKLKIISKEHQFMVFNVVYSQEFTVYYGLAGILSIVFLSMHCIFWAIFIIYNFRALCKNSPWNLGKCAIFGIKLCGYVSAAAGLAIGVPGVDYLFENAGQVPPLRWTYAKRHISFFGSNEKNCGIVEGEIVKPNTMLKRIIRRGQEWTLAENATSHAEYIKLKEENKIPISEREEYLKYLKDK